MVTVSRVGHLLKFNSQPNSQPNLNPGKSKSSNLQNNSASNVAFKGVWVTLSEKNLGRVIQETVIEPFNKRLLPFFLESRNKSAFDLIGPTKKGATIRTPQDLVDKVKFFVLGAGSGGRFKHLAQTVGDYNKISLPFTITRSQDLHMLDFALALGKYCVERRGVRTIVAKDPSGSFGDIIKHYLAGNTIQDTIVCCGDNVFNEKASNLMRFFTQRINDPNKHIAIIGLKRPPEEVADRIAMLRVEQGSESDVVKLVDFSEKPKLEDAIELAKETGGLNYSNTGLFYISKEAMTKLIEEIRSGVNNIKKNDKEPYDFAIATKYIHSKLPQWFGIESKEGADVKIVQEWEDLGVPKSLYKFLQDVKDTGKYIGVFPKPFARAIRKAFDKRINLEGDNPAILFGNRRESLAQIPEIEIKGSPIIDGVHIVQ